MDIKEALLPEIQSKTVVSLSPFTWTNLKLPSFNSIKQKTKSVSQKKTLLTSKEFQTLHLKTIQQKPKQPKQVSLEKVKAKKQAHKANKKMDGNTTTTQALQPRLENQRYRLRSKIQRLNKTIQLARNQQSSKQKAEKKKIRFLDDKNNMEKYLRTNLARAGWSSNTRNSKNQGNLLWSNIDKISDHNGLKDGQFYNHLNGSFHLTHKDKLNQIVSGKPYYSKSYLIPKSYEEFARQNNRIAIKCMLKVISKEIDQFVNSDGSQNELMQVNLWEILQSSFIKLANEQTTILCKLCMYLQQVRRQERYNQYFQKFQDYHHFNLSPKQHFYDVLIQKSFAYLQGVKTQYLNISYKDIDYRLLILVLHYHRLFSQYDQAYQGGIPLWIIKPIASSRGAGISIVRPLRELCINPDSMWSEFKNKKKYENKIIQRYISNPYILQKPHLFAGRKFDIRQWVLVSSHKQRPIIYRYHTGYCRFAHEIFSVNKLNKQIHLTNYSVFKTVQEGNEIPSILMLEDLFTVAFGDLRNRFNQQINYIITDCILSCSQIRYQQGCFELFGFDFLIDSNEKVFLLQVNLNPACNAERHPKLKQQSQMMTKTMIQLITQSKPSNKWVKLYGVNETLDSSSQAQDLRLRTGQQLEIKPYYQYQLTDDESLIGYIRYKNKVLSRMFQLSYKFLCKNFLRQLGCKGFQQSRGLSSEENLNELIHFIQEKSVSNL